MKKVVLAAGLALASTAAFAGGYSEPVIEAPVIVEETSSSSMGSAALILLGLLAVAAIAAD